MTKYAALLTNLLIALCFCSPKQKKAVAGSSGRAKNPNLNLARIAGTEDNYRHIRAAARALPMSNKINPKRREPTAAAAAAGAGVTGVPTNTSSSTGSSSAGNTSSANTSSSSSSSLSSAGGGDAGMSADLTSLFECPVCFDYVLPPILQ